jgi:Tfp pilus assembly protein PilO
MRNLAFKARQELGALGMAALVLMAAALAFSVLVLEPLEKRNELLRGSLQRAPKDAPSGQKVEAVYSFLNKNEETTDWLAKLYGIGKATGVELKSAKYQSHGDGGRIERYEIVLPAAGSYSQIRDFLKRALAEIPVMSLDSLALKRGEHAIQAEMRLTLHMVKS